MPKRQQTIQDRIKRITKPSFYAPYYKSTTVYIKKKPFTSFFIALFLLFAVIVLSNIFTRPKPQKIVSPAAKTVSVYTIGEAPKVTFQAKVDKPGVIKIVALSGGVIQDISVSAGDTVTKGEQLFSLSTNYQGGNAQVIGDQIAFAQYKNVLDTFNGQKNAIQKQRDIANSSHDNFSDMQNIATQSAHDTNNLISSNQTVLDQLNTLLAQSQANGASPSSLIPLESQINQLQAAQNQLRAGLSTLQEQTDSTKPPGRLADTQRDLALAQLDIQEKSLVLGKEVSKLQAEIADITAATMFPVSPFAGTVERVYVRLGQQVNPGTPLAELSASDPKNMAIVDVPEAIARKISSLDPSTLYVGKRSYDILPAFIPSEATDGSLFSIMYPLPDDSNTKLSDGEYLTIDIPVGHADTLASVPFIPLDAIYQTQDSNYVFISSNKTATVRAVSIGQIFGNFAEITSGLRSGDEVILNRNIIAGDKVIN